MALPGGAVRDPAVDQNFRALDQRLAALEARLGGVVAELPAAGVESEVVYDLATHALYYFNGTEWIKT